MDILWSYMEAYRCYNKENQEFKFIQKAISAETNKFLQMKYHTYVKLKKLTSCWLFVDKLPLLLHPISTTAICYDTTKWIYHLAQISFLWLFNQWVFIAYDCGGADL